MLTKIKQTKGSRKKTSDEFSIDDYIKSIVDSATKKFKLTQKQALSFKNGLNLSEILAVIFNPLRTSSKLNSKDFKLLCLHCKNTQEVHQLITFLSTNIGRINRFLDNLEDNCFVNFFYPWQTEGDFEQKLRRLENVKENIHQLKLLNYPLNEIAIFLNKFDHQNIEKASRALIEYDDNISTISTAANKSSYKKKFLIILTKNLEKFSGNYEKFVATTHEIISYFKQIEMLLKFDDNSNPTLLYHPNIIEILKRDKTDVNRFFSFISFPENFKKFSKIVIFCRKYFSRRNRQKRALSEFFNRLINFVVLGDTAMKVERIYQTSCNLESKFKEIPIKNLLVCDPIIKFINLFTNKAFEKKFWSNSAEEISESLLSDISQLLKSQSQSKSHESENKLTQSLIPAKYKKPRLNQDPYDQIIPETVFKNPQEKFKEFDNSEESTESKEFAQFPKSLDFEQSIESDQVRKLDEPQRNKEYEELREFHELTEFEEFIDPDETLKIEETHETKKTSEFDELGKIAESVWEDLETETQIPQTFTKINPKNHKNEEHLLSSINFSGQGYFNDLPKNSTPLIPPNSLSTIPQIPQHSLDSQNNYHRSLQDYPLPLITSSQDQPSFHPDIKNAKPLAKSAKKIKDQTLT